jgi:hypothetical protein
MWGEKDSWGSLEHATRWKDDISDSILVTYPLAGHSIMEEFPTESVADAIAFFTNEPLPSIEGLGIGGSFTISEAAEGFDKEAMFGSDTPDGIETEDSHIDQEGEETLMEDSPE